MNYTDSRELIDYFKNKSGKYLKLNNGEKVKLSVVKYFEYSLTLTLTFAYNGKILDISFTELYGSFVTMYIPDGLEKGYFVSPIVKFSSLKNIGYALENILTNWTERKDEISLNWEE